MNPTGVIWRGPVYDRGGYGNVSRNYVLGLRRLGFPVRVVPVGEEHDDVDPESVAILRSLETADVGGDPAVVVHGVPPDFPSAANLSPRANTRRIGCTIFETDRIPVGWARECNHMDEVWVPSEFNRRTFSQWGVELDKLRVLPYAVDTRYFSPGNPRVEPYEFPAGTRQFRFLYNFGFDYRKGADLLLQAYWSEFSAGEDVALVLKTYVPAHFTREDRAAAGRPCDVRTELAHLLLGKTDLISGPRAQVLVLDQPLQQEKLLGLYLACDAYISTDRANGWGMPCHEMMALGKPVATIDWSGSTEFMNEANSFLIHPTGRMEPVATALQRTRPIYAGHLWAEVDVAEVRRVLRQMYEDAVLRQCVAARARQDVREFYSLEAIAGKMVDLLTMREGGATTNVAASLESTAAPLQELALPGEVAYQRGLELLQQGSVEESLQLLTDSLTAEETGERWNDWAIAQLTRSCDGEAEQGFRRALELSPNHQQAMANLGLLLMNQHRFMEAIGYLGKAASNAGPEERAELLTLLVDCSTRLAG